MSLPRHPDTIPDLAPDCRRVLREEFAVVQSSATSHQVLSAGANNDAPLKYDERSGQLRVNTDVPVDQGTHRKMGASNTSLSAAIAEYRRVAALWGVDVG